MLQINADIQFFIFGDNGVLFHPTTNRLWVLNPVVATIWCLLPEYKTIGELQNQLVSRFGIDNEQAAKDVTQCLNYFEQEGLLQGGHQPGISDVENQKGVRLKEVDYQVPQEWACESYISLLGCVVRFESEEQKLGQQFMAHLQHMQLEEVPAKIDAQISVAREPENKGWSVFLDGKLYIKNVADNSVLPHLYFLLFNSITRKLDSCFLLHGAVLEYGKKTVILPGEAKSGKTTIAAILTAKGWYFYSDELVVLDVEKGTVHPFPLPMSIKPGSLDVLRPFYPELEMAKVWDRVDGQQVRFLLPPENALPDSLEKESVPSFLIFPQYDPDNCIRLVEIGKVEALQRLVTTGSSNRPLQATDIEAMIALVERCPTFSLVFDNAEEAVKLIKSQVTSL